MRSQSKKRLSTEARSRNGVAAPVGAGSSVSSSKRPAAVNDLDRVIRQCEQAGLKYERGSKHAKLRDPLTNRSISVACTPRCPHAHKRVLRDLRVYLGVTLTP